MSGVVFGTQFTDHMFCMEWEENKGWNNAKIKPYSPFMIEPSAMVLHYAQMSFEGLKAYHTYSGENVLFRPRENFKRMNNTSIRMCMPEIEVEEILSALKQLLCLDSKCNEDGSCKKCIEGYEGLNCNKCDKFYKRINNK